MAQLGNQWWVTAIGATSTVFVGKDLWTAQSGLDRRQEYLEGKCSILFLSRTLQDKNTRKANGKLGV